MQLRLLVLGGALALHADALVVAPLRPTGATAARTTEAQSFFDLKKMIDPEGAMERGALLNDINSKDSSPEAMAAAERRQETAARKKAEGNKGLLANDTGFNPFGSFNPFGKK